MSRTYRKRRKSFEKYYSYWNFNSDGSMTSMWGYDCSPEEANRLRYQYKTQSDKRYTHTLPKFFRNTTNRARRSHDRQELRKELNINDYEGLYSKWNCKDNNSWGYW